MSLTSAAAVAASGAGYTTATKSHSSKWSQNIEIVARGRRNSAAKIFDRFRSGSLPGWIGGGQRKSSGSIQIENNTHEMSMPLSSSSRSGQPRYSPDHKDTGGVNSGSTSNIVKVYPQLHYPREMPDFLVQGQAEKQLSTQLPPSNLLEMQLDCQAAPSATSYFIKNTAENELFFPSIPPLYDQGNGGTGIPNHQVPSHKIGFKASDIPSNESSPLTTRKHGPTIVPMKSFDEMEKGKKRAKKEGNDALALILSALYGKLLVVMGIAFPMSEVISTYIPSSFYDGFYLYLYFGSIIFMICIYGNILRQKATRTVRGTIRRINTRLRPSPGDAPGGDSAGSSTDSPHASPHISKFHRNKSTMEVDGHGRHHQNDSHDDGLLRIHFGSFYLRMGAVAFGIGSLIYSGLEFGQYFELEPDTKCSNIMIALTPAVRMVFTFMQMYFIFLNSKVAVRKVRFVAKFGLMHMIGTHLCVWLNVIIQETRHEILHFYNPDDNVTATYPSHDDGHGHGHHGHSITTIVPTTLATTLSTTFSTTTTTSTTTTATTTSTTTPTPTFTTTEYSDFLDSDFAISSENQTDNVLEGLLGLAEVHHRMKRGLKGPYSMYECRRSDIMGALVQNASSFLFPCTIEYSLICAAILYVMWKSLARPKYPADGKTNSLHARESRNCHGAKRSPHNYSVDCSRANKGLFFGIFFLVMTIISLIIFFVLVSRPGHQALAVLEINITELVLYTTTTIAVLIGMCQVRELRYVRGRNLELDNILLIVAQSGSFIYSVFTIICGHFTITKTTPLVLVTALASLVQVLFQTLFILDASKRAAQTPEQTRKKPGREVVTFLLVTNLAMWAINTLEKSRADSHPVQLKFYGVWAWTIITHISMPLAIYYRFHSTVILCEIWKRAYKIKSSSMYH